MQCHLAPCLALEKRLAQEPQQEQELRTTSLTKWLATREQKQINSFVKISCNILRAALEYVKLSVSVANLQNTYQCQVIVCRLN